MNKQRGFTLKKYIAKTISKELISLSILFFILCISFASADILEGGIFDYELNSLIDTVIQEVGAESMADFGKVMPEVMKRGAGQVDGGMAQALLKSKLS